ncbi:MAG: flippase-like domain-containing protein [Clostridia bacterium]|nr:flippase-like domain-containing protein [Clostridia bacterium]
MAKITKQTRSNILNALVIFLTIGIVIYLGAANGEIGDAWVALRSSNPFWIGAAVLSYGIFMIFEAMGVHVFFRQQGLKPKFRSTLLVSIIGMFYSSVTPAATGGQPMQVFAFKKRGIPAGISSSALAVKFFCFQVALLSLGGLFWILHPDIVNACVNRARVIVVTGFVLNGITVAAVLLLAINKNIVRGIITLLINLGKKLRIVKDVARTTSKLDAALADFHASVDMVTHHPGQLLVLILISCIQVMGLMSVSYCVYRAMGQSGHLFGEILALQFLLYIGASFTPLPGASGAQEGGFYIFFQDIFPANKMLGALLLWRFFTYYLSLIVGLGCVVWDSSTSMKRKTNELQSEINEYSKKGLGNGVQEDQNSPGCAAAPAQGNSEEAD